MKKNPRPISVTISTLLVAATALPMVPVWWAQQHPSKPGYAAGAPTPGQDTTTPNSPANESRTLAVDLRDDTTPSQIQALDARYHIDLEPNSIEAQANKLMRVTVPVGQDTAALVEALRNDGQVEAAEPEIRVGLPEQGKLAGGQLDKHAANAPKKAAQAGPLSWLQRRFVPNDPRYGEQWDFQMVGAEAAWRRTRGKGVVVAVIDTGVAYPDSPRGNGARDFTTTRFVAGYDFIHKDDDPYDDNGHGTHVAGTIAESTNNQEGVAGLAFEASIMPLKVLSAEGWGNAADVADAIRYAADHGANVINMSLGSFYPSDVERAACKYAARKGVVIVCAAGNSFGEGVGYPAAFPECIAVSSVGPNGNLAVYSSYGKEVTLAAPGGDMFSNGEEGGILQNTVISPDWGGAGDSYYFFQGTSMASPHVAAVAALLEAQGVRDRARVRDLLARSASVVPSGSRLQYGAGILSADRATALGASLSHRQHLKSLLFLALAALALALPLGSPLGTRLAFVAALWAGCFLPDQVAQSVGADSPWNLLAFSAFLPFMLFWEWEHGAGSRVVAALSTGCALSLSWSLMTGLSPFTVTTFGQRPLLWTIANIAAAGVLAVLAWERAKVKEV